MRRLLSSTTLHDGHVELARNLFGCGGSRCKVHTAASARACHQSVMQDLKTFFSPFFVGQKKRGHGQGAGQGGWQQWGGR